MIKTYNLQETIVTAVIGCGFLFLLLDLFWFLIILRLLARMLFYPSKPMIDFRECDAAEEEKELKLLQKERKKINWK